MTVYPGFHHLPKGVKQLLLVSENFFFEQVRTRPVNLSAQLTAMLPLPLVVAPETPAVLARAA